MKTRTVHPRRILATKGPTVPYVPQDQEYRDRQEEAAKKKSSFKYEQVDTANTGQPMIKWQGLSVHVLFLLKINKTAQPNLRP